MKVIGLSDKALVLIKAYLEDRKQSVVVNGTGSSWKNINAGVPQGSVLGPLLFLIFINDLPEELICNPKLFADDVSLIAIMHDNEESTKTIENDLQKLSEWSVKWKMQFIPDPTKQVNEIIFSWKRLKPHHPSLIFNGNLVSKSEIYTHLGLSLYPNLCFQKQYQRKINFGK